MKTLKISTALHSAAKLAAFQQGVKLQEFVENVLSARLTPSDSCVHGIHFSLPCKECRQIKK